MLVKGEAAHQGSEVVSLYSKEFRRQWNSNLLYDLLEFYDFEVNSSTLGYTFTTTLLESGRNQRDRKASIVE